MKGNQKNIRKLRKRTIEERNWRKERLKKKLEKIMIQNLPLQDPSLLIQQSQRFYKHSPSAFQRKLPNFSGLFRLMTRW